ncbi:hypothetical protein [Paenibacillus turpanensis]|uniref:hypothetical protein n=1 Tax=Paenibacillus turpanensis TaxID=2689078 RepID=UPI001407A42D|nr:hypothetical protein [Paenibacillus turpanensis]
MKIDGVYILFFMLLVCIFAYKDYHKAKKKNTGYKVLMALLYGLTLSSFVLSMLDITNFLPTEFFIHQVSPFVKQMLGLKAS